MGRIVLALLAALVLVGCNPTPRNPDEVTFVGWGGPEEHAIFTQALADFRQRRPDIQVRYIQIPGLGYDYFNKLRLMIVGGLAPDVFYVPDQNFGELASHDVLLDLEPYIAHSGLKLDDFWPSGLSRYRWDGHRVQGGNLFCLPKDIGPNAMFFNQDVLTARHVTFPPAGRPMTWQEALDAWKQLTFSDQGVRHYGVSGFPCEAAVWSSGAQYLSDDKRTFMLDSPVAAGAIQWCADLSLVQGVAPLATASGSASPTQLFESGLAAMHIDGRWMVPRYRTLGFKWDVCPVPVPQVGVSSVDWSGSVGLGIYRLSPHAQAAFDLVAYLAGPDGQAVLTRAGLQVPNQRWLAQTDVYRQPGQEPAHPEVFLAAAQDSRPGPWTDTPNSFWHDVLWNYLPTVFRGDQTAQRVLDQDAPAIQRALRDYNAP